MFIHLFKNQIKASDFKCLFVGVRACRMANMASNVMRKYGKSVLFELNINSSICWMVVAGFFFST